MVRVALDDAAVVAWRCRDALCSYNSVVTKLQNDVPFSWDQNKNRVNQQKHGVSFELAQIALDDPHAVSRQDRFENDELRWQTIGKVGDTMLILLVAHTLNEVDGHEEHIRIISARRATRVERKVYEQSP